MTRKHAKQIAQTPRAFDPERNDYSELATALGGYRARVEGKGQFVDYVEHVTITTLNVNIGAKHTLRVRIVLGGYADQSYGVIERWNGAQWHEVATVKGAALRTDLKLGYRQTFGAVDFIEDRNTLVALAEEVL